MAEDVGDQRRGHGIAGIERVVVSEDRQRRAIAQFLEERGDRRVRQGEIVGRHANHRVCSYRGGVLAELECLADAAGGGSSDYRYLPGAFLHRGSCQLPALVPVQVRELACPPGCHDRVHSAVYEPSDQPASRGQVYGPVGIEGGHHRGNHTAYCLQIQRHHQPPTGRSVPRLMVLVTLVAATIVPRLTTHRRLACRRSASCMSSESRTTRSAVQPGSMAYPRTPMIWAAECRIDASAASISAGTDSWAAWHRISAT